MSFFSGVDAFFGWMGELFVSHPLAFIFTVPLSIYMTYVVVKFVNDDINRRNQKLGMNPRNDTSEAGMLIIAMVVALFCGILFGSYSLLVWLGEVLLAEPNF
jgi:hypothetical protein